MTHLLAPRRVRRPVRYLHVAATLLALVAACSTPGQPPSGPATDAAASGAKSSTGAPADGSDSPAPSPSDGSSAAADGPGSPSTVVAVEGLERLPRDAAVYAAVKPAVLDLLLKLAPTADRRDLLRELDQAIAGASEGLSRAVEQQLGIDAARSVLFAAVAPDTAKVKAAMEAIIAAKTAAAFDAATRGAETLAVHYRFVLPLRDQADPRRAIRLLAEHVVHTAQIDACPGAQGCAAFGAAAPSAIAAGRRGALAAYLGAGDVLIDVATPLFVEGGRPALWPILAAVHASPAGGPREPRCTALDAAADATACFDADAMAELAVAIGYGQVARAVAGGAVDPSMRAAIAQQGRAEAEQARHLSRPAKRLLDDGTIDIRPADGAIRIRASWTLAESARGSVAAAFASPRCVPHAGSQSRVLLVALRDAFGGLGADFADPKTRLRDVQEAGWGAWPVLLARTWPNFLGLDELLAPEPEVAKVLDRAKLCVSVDSERLVVETQTTPRG